MEELLRVITHENKNYVLTGDFILNLLKHAKSAGASKFLENLLSHNFMPQITLPFRITEKIFLRLIDKTLVQHAPVTKSIRKEQKLVLKPWVANGIKKSISVRDKLYKEMIKAKNNQIKKKYETYKTYRNKIVDFLRVSRKCHYQKYLEENRKSSRAIWQGIHDTVYSKKSKKNNTPSSLLIEGKTIRNPKDMAENFNNFFTSFGTKPQSNVPLIRRCYIHYLKHLNPETFFISPTTPDGITNIKSP